ncbi:Hypothetical predicted protein [Lecanosticta acicola]|uniref:Uncharacterized protein n=1 Tax=Lecanosticta acicola TaxID=111012 RepID=A0AAI9EDG2_9PEZI|nr:Hypothetical predicted protein [Lecanosticta acicola]
MGDVAQYYHGSLYAFNADAVTAIVTKFARAADNVAVRCWYEPSQDLFVVECPTTVGSDANEVLEREIRAYVEKELAAADREQRAPAIQRFADSEFDAIDNFSAADTEQQSCVKVTTAPATHLVRAKDPDKMLISAFHLHELPFLDRTLAPRSRRVTKLFSVGITWRVVRWDRDCGHVFNGRIGEPRPVKANLDLEMPAFETLQDERDLSTVSVRLPYKKWEFEGHPVTVEQWRAGMGRTRQVLPDEKPAMPKDAERFMADHSSGLVRARKDSSDDDERNDNFNALLSGRRAPEDDTHSSSSEAKSRDSEDDEHDEHDAPEMSFRELLPKDKYETFPTYGRQFAKVDSIGLTANARDTAEWVDRHHKSHGKNGRRLKKSDALTYKPSEAPDGNSIDKGVEWPPMARKSLIFRESVKAPPGLLPEQDLHTVQKAANNTETDETPRLVDFSENPLKAQVTPQQGFVRQAKSPYAALTPDTPMAGSSKSADDEIVERVKTLPSDYGIKRNTMRQQARRKAKKGKSVANVAGKSSTPNVALPLPDPVPSPKPKPKNVEERPFTGIQKHMLNVRTSKEAAAQPGIAMTTSSRQDLSLSETSFESITSPTHTFGQFLQQTEARYSGSESDSEDGEPALPFKLVAHVGTLLTTPSNKEIENGTISAGLLQREFAKASHTARADFLTRLTTSTSDVHYLLDATSDQDTLQKEAFYEIFVRATTGSMLKITIPSGGKSNFYVESHDKVVQEAFAHYPMHVWDLRFRVVEAGGECESPPALKDLVQSLQTDEDAPSFLGMIRSELFTVEKVLTKRVFAQKLERGVGFRLTQVQNLFLESLDDQYHNFRAFALSEKSMLDNQRVFWEACWETGNLRSAELLQAKAGEMMGVMDSVGLENQGPLIPTPTAEADEEEDEDDPDDWFW